MPIKQNRRIYNKTIIKYKELNKLNKLNKNRTN